VKDLRFTLSSPPLSPSGTASGPLPGCGRPYVPPKFDHGQLVIQHQRAGAVIEFQELLALDQDQMRISG
jgi:hypothetical protein